MKKKSVFHYIHQCLQENEVLHNSWALGYFKLLIIKICLRFALMLLVGIMVPMCIAPPSSQTLFWGVLFWWGTMCPQYGAYASSLQLESPFIYPLISLAIFGEFQRIPMEKMLYVFLDQKMPIIFWIDNYTNGDWSLLTMRRMWDQMLFNELVVLAFHFDCSIVPENMQTTC
jgi:hypothetical protein